MIRSTESASGPINNTTNGAFPVTADVLMNFDTSVTTDDAGLLTWTNFGVVQDANSKFGPFSGGFSRNAFLRTPYTATDDLGVNTVWTVEAWVYLNQPQTSIGTYRLVVFGKSLASSGFEVEIASDAIGVIYPGFGGPSRPTSMAAGQWYYLTWCRSGSVYWFGINGSVVSTFYAGGIAGASGDIQIGGNFNNDTIISYRIDNLRVVLGHALYTQSFNVPTAPQQVIPPYIEFGKLNDPFVKYDALLLHGTWEDSARGRVVNRTVSNATSITQSAVVKLNQTSLYFNNTNANYLSIPASPNIHFGAGDFTIECYVYVNAQSSATPSIMSNYTSWVAGGWTLCYSHASPPAGAPNAFSFWAFNFSNSAPLLLSPVHLPNRWYHVAVIRSGNSFFLFVDGVLEATNTLAGALDSGTTNTLFIGPADANGFNGYIDELRISRVNRTKVPSPTSYPVPTYPYLNDGKTHTPIPTDPNWYSVSYLLHGDGLNNGLTFSNSTSTGDPARAVSGTGNVVTSTTNPKFGTSSMFFSGGDSTTTNGASLSWADAAPNQLGLGDFTAEMWINPTTIKDSILFSKYVGGSANRYVLTINAVGILAFVIQNTTSATVFQVNAVTPIVAGVWAHVAVVRSGTLWTLFINGITEASGTFSFNLNVTGPFCIGQFINANSGFRYNYGGYIDEFRVTKGVARYTANFTPQTAPFPNS